MAQELAESSAEQVLEGSQPSIKQTAQGKDTEESVKQTAQGKETSEEQRFREEIELLNFKGLLKQAQLLGVTEEEVEAARKEEEKEDALIEVIMLYWRKNRESSQPISVPAPLQGLAMQEPGEPVWFEAVKKFVFIKARITNQSQTLGYIREGTWIEVQKAQIEGDYESMWVELTPDQMSRSCPGVQKDMRGYCLIDGTELELGGVLLRALPTPSQEEIDMKRQEEDATELLREEQRESKSKEKAQRKGTEKKENVEENTRKDRSAAIHDLREEARAKAEHDNSLRRHAVPYRAVLDSVVIAEAKDPESSHAPLMRGMCYPGECFFATNKLYNGKDGKVWVEQSMFSWLLVQDANDIRMVKEEDVTDFIRVCVHWGKAEMGEDICILDTFILRTTSIKMLKAMLCEQKGLTLKSIILMPRTDQIRLPTKSLELDNGRTLDSYNISQNGQQVDLTLFYIDDFVADVEAFTKSDARRTSVRHLARKLNKDRPARNNFQAILEAWEDNRFNTKSRSPSPVSRKLKAPYA